MFRKLLGCSILSLLFISCRNRLPVDMLVYNAVLYTVDSNFSIAEAMAIQDGKVLEVGKSDDLLLKYKAEKPVNARGFAVYPGFIDAHSHFLGYGRSIFEVNLFGCKNWEEALARVKKFALEHPKELWIRGRGWDQNIWPGKSYPDNTILNALFPDKAVLLQRVDGHAAIANARALDAGHVVAGTTITGGSIEVRDGQLTGLLIDNAVDLVTSAIPRPDRSAYAKWLKAAQDSCFRVGLTTVTDCGLMYYEIEQIDSLQKKKDLQMRVYAMLTDSAINFEKYISKGPYKTEKLYVKGVKAYADGALGSRGACLRADYSDQPGWKGFLLSPATHFDSLANMLVNTDFQLCTHAIGDSGNRVVLGIYNKVLKGKNDKRWRIEHAQVVATEDFSLFGSASIIPSVQPVHATSDMPWATDRLGKERLMGGYALKQLLQQNGWLPLGTDFPVEDISPVRTFYAAVIRKDAKGNPASGFQTENALTRQEAIRGITIWAAKACFLDKEIGSLEVGKKADFIILNNDPMKVKDHQILDVQVFNAFINGEKVSGD